MVSRDHILLKFPDDELAECETEDERQALIEEYVQSDFDQNISWSITRKD